MCDDSQSNYQLHLNVNTTWLNSSKIQQKPLEGDGRDGFLQLLMVWKSKTETRITWFCTWPSAFQFVHRSSKHHYLKLWIESSLIRRWHTNLHLLNRWHSYWVIKNASELYYRGICLDGSILKNSILARLSFFLLARNRRRRSLLTFSPCGVGQWDESSRFCKEVGCLFWQWFEFSSAHFTGSSSCFYHIRDLKRIRNSLLLALAKQIAVALVTSKLDYCNSLLHEIPAKDLQQLQRVQNCLARIVTKALHFSRSIPLLKSLHWPPIKFRIQFKICTFVFHCLNDGQPSYLSSLFFLQTP